MPVVAVALAAGSFAAGATAFAAATTLAGSIAAGAMMAGAALTIVGTITKNPKLTKIGAVLSIAGGLGTMAINMTSGAANAASAAEGAASGAAEAATAGATEGLAAAAGEAVTSGIEAPFTDILANAGAPAVDAAAGAGQAAATGGGMIESAIKAGATDTAAQAMTGVTDHLAKAATDATSAFKTGTDALTASVSNVAAPIDIVKPVGVDAFAVPYAVDGAAKTGMLGSVSAWAKANPEMAKMAMSGVQGMAGSLAPSAKDKAMMEAYRAQQAQTVAQTEALNRRARWGSGRI